jgi:hypothetical protein
MCGKCDEIDAKIMRYKRIAAQINDKVLQEGASRFAGKAAGPNRKRSKVAL